jgi:hypothetical protein
MWNYSHLHYRIQKGPDSEVLISSSGVSRDIEQRKMKARRVQTAVLLFVLFISK